MSVFDSEFEFTATECVCFARGLQPPHRDFQLWEEPASRLMERWLLAVLPFECCWYVTRNVPGSRWMFRTPWEGVRVERLLRLVYHQISAIHSLRPALHPNGYAQAVADQTRERVGYLAALNRGQFEAEEVLTQLAHR